MKREELQELALRALGEIAPEADLDSLDVRADLREQRDLDSMDLLNYVTAMSQQTGVDVPEVDYPELFTLDGAVGYFAARL
jgi:acyl carrier protein